MAQQHLEAGQAILLRPIDQDLQCASLVIETGICRLFAAPNELESDTTLALSGANETSLIRLPKAMTCMLEAITPAKLSLDYLPSCPPEADLIYEWLLELHLVRHPIGAETRLNKLLQLLVNHFGIRQAEGYCLPFMLSHNRLAEMIGATRSTVTRQLNHLKHNGLIAVSKQVNSMSLSTEFMQTMP